MVRLNRNSIQTTGKVDSVNIAFPERVFKETNPEDSGKRNIYSWKNIDNSVPAVILKLDHYQSLGIIRSLGKLKIPVYGIGISGISHSSLSRYCKKSFTIDMDNLGDEKLNNFLLNLADRLNKRPVLIPTTDETALFVARNSEQLRNHFIFSDSPADVISSFSNKKDCYFLARHYGIPTQKSIFPLTTNEVINFSREAVYPLVLKGIDGGKLEKKAGKKMVIVENRSELLSYYKLLEDRDYPNLIIQEYIPQDHNQMWIFNGYFDLHSNCKAAFTGIKIRQNPIYTGMTSFGVCRWNDKLIDLSSKLMKEVGYHGPVDIDFIYDKNDNTYKILDVNPRIGATFRMFVGKNGIDIARAMYLDLTGQQINFSRPEEERKWFVEDKD